jgi:hypothetical protein
VTGPPRAHHTDLPPTLLRLPLFIEACQARDIGLVFSLAKRHAGIYPSRIARLVDMTPSRVGEIITRLRTVTSMSTIERISDGLRIAGHLLGLARRPWERSEEPAASPVAPIPARCQPGGLPPSGSADAGSADLAVIDSFRAADRRVGGRHLYAAVVGHLTYSLAPRLVADRPGAQVSTTFGAAFTLTEMAGWMAHDSGDDRSARTHLYRAAALARATGDADVEAHVHASLAHLEAETGNLGAALESADAGTAIALNRAAHPQLLSRLAAMRARAHSRLGDLNATRTALADAETALALNPHAPLAPWVSGFDRASLASEAAQCYLDLDQPAGATIYARQAVELRSADRARSLALGRLLLAETHTRQGDLDAACHVGTRLLDDCHSVGSARVIRGLEHLRTLLAPHRTERTVAAFLGELDESLRHDNALFHRTDPAHRLDLAP